MGSLKIGVDFMLVIDYFFLELILKLLGFLKNFKELFYKYGCYVILKLCYIDYWVFIKCWFVIFLCMECELINNMNEYYKKCYKILKLLISSDIIMLRKCMNLLFYILKNVFLFYVYGENGCLFFEILLLCVCDVLDYLFLNLYYIKILCFFVRDMNIWGLF